jgi:hypothetical protein
VIAEGMPGAGWGGWANAANQNPFGRILCFTDDVVYGYGRVKVQGGPVGHRADAYHLFALDPQAASTKTDGRGRKVRTKGQLLWSKPDSLVVRAMVLGRDRLAVAGPPDLGKKETALLAFQNEPEARAAFQGRKGVFLRIVAPADGKILFETALPAMPVFDGMAAAGGRLFLSTTDGKVLCLGKEDAR